MSLRRKWLATLVLLAIPTVATVVWVQDALAQAVEVESLHRFVLGRMEEGRAHCESDPERFPPPPGGPGRPSGRRGGPRGRHPEGRPPHGGRAEKRPPQEGRPVELFAYDSEFVSANPRAPRFPVALRDRLLEGASKASEWIEDGRDSGLRLAVRMAWDEGPCAIVVATRFGPRPHAPWTQGPWISSSLAVVLLAGATWLAAGPLVTRLRRLTVDVRRSAGTGYATSVRVSGSDELTALAREFNGAGTAIRTQMEALEERERVLRTFVANTTHDVMIPMTVLKGHLGRLESDPSNTSALRGAMEESQYMTSLIENLGTSARLDATPTECERSSIRLDALVQRVAARHAPLARARELTLEFAVPEHPLVIEGDGTLLEQAIGNLVQNAVQYGIPGGHVAVLLEQRGPDPWCLRVLDDGPGIAPDALASLVERSSRGDEARGRHPEGQGLGLAIVREVAERHDFDLCFGRSEFGGLEVSLGPRAKPGRA